MYLWFLLIHNVFVFEFTSREKFIALKVPAIKSKSNVISHILLFRKPERMKESIVIGQHFKSSNIYLSSWKFWKLTSELEEINNCKYSRTISNLSTSYDTKPLNLTCVCWLFVWSPIQIVELHLSLITKWFIEYHQNKQTISFGTWSVLNSEIFIASIFFVQ